MKSPDLNKAIRNARVWMCIMNYFVGFGGFLAMSTFTS